MYDNNINNQQLTNEPQPPKAPKQKQSTAKVAALLAGVLLVGAGSSLPCGQSKSADGRFGQCAEQPDKFGRFLKAGRSLLRCAVQRANA